MKESKLPQAIGFIIDLVFVGILWLLCSLPVLTLGPAATALYYAVVKNVRHDRGQLSRVFFAGLKRNFRQSFPMWLLYLGLLALAALDIYGYSHMGLDRGRQLSALGGVLLIPAVLSFPWMFAYISRFDNSFGGSLRFVSFLCFRHIGRTLLLTLELLGFLAIAWLIPYLLPIIPGPFALLMSLQIEPVFRTYTLDQGGGKDAWYNE